MCFILISERRGRVRIHLLRLLASSGGGGGGRIQSAADGLHRVVCVAAAEQQVERDANAMHFALEPASSARLGFVFFMQLRARSRAR